MTIFICMRACQDVRPVVVVRMGANMPGGGEDSEASAEALIVDGTSVDGEKPHQQDEIASSKHHTPDLNTKKEKTNTCE